MTESSQDGTASSESLLDRHGAPGAVAIVLWAIGAIVAVMLAIPTTEVWLQAIDDAAYRLVVANEVSALVTLGEVLAFVGSARFMVPFIIVVAVALALSRRWWAVGTWMLAIMISQFLNTPLKVLYGRERPPLPLVETTGYAFPSGHALTGAVVAITLVIVLAPSGRKRRYLEFVAILYVLVMAWSRVYVRAHWLSDVTAGLAFGAAAALTAALIIDRLRERTKR